MRNARNAHVTNIEAFVYYGLYGLKYNGNSKNYGIKWGTKGDIIECNLNCETMELSFIVNDKNQGIAYKLNKNKKYHFVWQTFNKNDSIDVVSEKIEYTEKNNDNMNAPFQSKALFRYVCVFLANNRCFVFFWFFFWFFGFVGIRYIFF